MPTFGADPDAPEKEWTTSAPASRYVSKPVRELTNYFAYHKDMKMSQRFNDEDRSIMNIFFSRQLKKGFTPASLRNTVDRFFQSPAGQHEYPARMFAKTEVQQSLNEESYIQIKDPIVQWFIDGMPTRTELFDYPKDVRKCLLLYADESMLRYPDVLADVIRNDWREPVFTNMVTALEDLIRWNLYGEGDATPLLDTLANISLPDELQTKSRSVSGLRPRRDTVLQAVTSIPRKRPKQEW